MSDSPYGPVDDPDPFWDSHIQRLNPHTSPADIVGQGVVHTRDTIGGIPRATQETTMSDTLLPLPVPTPSSPLDNALRHEAFAAAVQVGGPGPDIVANFQLFLAALRGLSDVPVKLVEGPKGDPGEPGTPADMSRVVALENAMTALTERVAALETSAHAPAPPPPAAEPTPNE
jgi:hypothetical protein